jgi:hypothetical protein
VPRCTGISGPVAPGIIVFLTPAFAVYELGWDRVRRILRASMPA